MEEAARLASKVVIMDTQLLACGTPAGLSRTHGKGVFQIHIVHREGLLTSVHHMEKIRDWMTQHVQEFKTGRPASMMHGQLRLHVVLGEQPSDPQPSEVAGYYGGKERSSPLVELLRLLEDTKHRFGVQHYSVRVLTLEDVFLQIITAGK